MVFTHLRDKKEAGTKGLPELVKPSIKGTYTAIVTPFTEDKLINHETLDKLLQRQIDAGIDGVVVAGCTGSDFCLSVREQIMLVKYVQQHFGDKLTVIAGDGSNTTEEAVELARQMEDRAKVFTHLSVSPYKCKPSDQGIIDHYRKIAESIDGNLILYSVPGRTGGKGIVPYVAEELSRFSHIIAIKEASGDIDRIKETIRRTEGRFDVLSGDDKLTWQVIRAGGTGVISVASNIVPGRIKEIADAALNGDNQIAQSNSDRLSGLYAALFPEAPKGVLMNPSPNPIPCHYALQLMDFEVGCDVGYPRSPLDAEPSLQEKKAVYEALRGLQLVL